ncbi:MAG: hypothetical protein ACTS5A_02730, partial [Candidatus Hodgkinia cicadicola]
MLVETMHHATTAPMSSIASQYKVAHINTSSNDLKVAIAAWKMTREVCDALSNVLCSGESEVRRFARVRWTAEVGFKRPPKVIRLSIARRTRGTSRCKVDWWDELRGTSTLWGSCGPMELFIGHGTLGGLEGSIGRVSDAIDVS